MIALRKPEPTIEQLKARAASGSSGVARKSQAELRARMIEALRREVRS